jgi:site-specific recombinase XerD
MPTKRKPDDWKPPRGIRIFQRSDRKKPYFVSWRDPETKKQRSTSFKTKDEQKIYAKQLAHNRSIQAVDMSKWMRFVEFERKIGGIEFLDDVERVYLSRPKVVGVLLKDAVEGFLKDKGYEGIAYGTLKRHERYLGKFCDAFPDVYLTDIHEDQITAWIQKLKDGRKAMQPVTKENYRKFLRTFFRWAAMKKMLLENPVDRVPKLKVPSKEVGILSVAEGEKLFQLNRDEPCIGRLALEAFAGLRYSSAQRIEKTDINFEDKGINLPAAKLKTGKRFYVDGFPDNLWRWMEHTPEDCWKLKDRQYQEAKRNAFIRAGVPHPHNCLRHSFSTYHVAKHKNVALTATLLCHTDLQMLNQHYRGVGTHADGKKWFEIVP